MIDKIGSDLYRNDGNLYFPKLSICFFIRKSVNFSMENLLQRMVRASLLDKNLYEEVEADPNALTQAMIVVALSSIAGAAGQEGLFSFGAMFKNVFAYFIGWLIWAGITYFIGTSILKGPNTESNIGELLRTLGFASAPGIIRILGILPLLGWLTHAIAAVWMLIAMVIAVRQALDYESTERAVAVCAIGFIPYMLIYWIIF